MVVVLAVAVYLRTYVCFTIQVRHTNKSFSLIHGDTIEYVHLGENLYRTGRYVDPTSVISRYRAVIRPPGYPLFYRALCEAGLNLRDHLSWIIWPQVTLSLAMPAMTMWLLYVLSRRRWLATAGGLASAASPTGVAIPALATADALFAVLFGVGFCLSIAVVMSPDAKVNRGRAALAGLFFASALLVKPALLTWPILLLGVLLGRVGFCRRTVMLAAAAMLPVAIVWAGWMVRNYDYEKLATFSAVGTRNLTYYVASKVQLTVQLGRAPTPTEFQAGFAAGQTAQENYMFHRKDATVAGLLRIQHRRNLVMMRAHPWTTLRVLASNFANQTSNRWKQIHRQIPGNDQTATNLRNAYDLTDHPAVVVAEWAGLALAIGPLLNRHSPARLRWQLAMLFAAWLSITLPLATVSDEGTRLAYPCEPMRQALWLFGAYWMLTNWRRRGIDPVSTTIADSTSCAGRM